MNGDSQNTPFSWFSLYYSINNLFVCRHEIVGVVTAVGNSVHKFQVDHDGTNTYGGYSDIIVVHPRFVVQFPENLPFDAGAPLLCAGITVYSPMKYYGMTEQGKHLGVAGLGGLGHIAAFGLKITVISTSPKKEDEAITKVGADAFVAVNTMDYIIETIIHWLRCAAY
uniref:Uncharacterized protein n=1 Tax=Solanum lycopersicum TaxID=4081 RepID=A0A3Q7FJP5_SOLLC